MTAPARGQPSRHPSPAAEAFRRLARPLVEAAILSLLILLAAPRAGAQVAATATFTTNYLYRGVSLSDGEPALAVGLAYDDRSGVYVGGSMIGEATRRQGVQALGHQEYLGYARRLRDGDTLDVGVNNLDYRYYYDYGSSHAEVDATEIYAGWVRGPVNYYLHYSPNYFHPGAHTLYAEANGSLRLPRPFRLFGHVGVLTPLGGGYDGKERYDLRAGVSVAFLRGEAQLAWTTSKPERTYADPPSEGRAVVALDLTWSF